MSRRNIITAVIISFVIIALCTAAVASLFFLRTPLSQQLNLNLTTPTPILQPTMPLFATEEPQPQPTPTRMMTPTVGLPTSITQCGMKGSITILLLGRDNNYWELPSGADAIRVVRINFDQQKALIFTFPRDLWVATPSLTENYSISKIRLGPLYTTIKNTEAQNPNADFLATNAVAQTLYDNFGIVSDHYVTLNETVLADVVDSINGIEVDVPKGFKAYGITFESGKQLMDGKKTMAYLRYAESQKDEWNRINRQNLVIKALQDKLSTPSVFPRIPELFQKSRQAVVTDFSPTNIVGLSCVGSQISMSQVAIDTIPQEYISITTEKLMVIKDVNQLKEYISKAFDF